MLRVAVAFLNNFFFWFLWLLFGFIPADLCRRFHARSASSYMCPYCTSPARRPVNASVMTCSSRCSATSPGAWFRIPRRFRCDATCHSWHIYSTYFPNGVGTSLRHTSSTLITPDPSLPAPPACVFSRQLTTHPIPSESANPITLSRSSHRIRHHPSASPLRRRVAPRPGPPPWQVLRFCNAVRSPNSWRRLIFACLLQRHISPVPSFLIQTIQPHRPPWRTAVNSRSWP